MKNEIEESAEERKYCVYIHTSPSGKRYIGQTGTAPQKRWKKDGAGYLHKTNGKYQQPAFASAILKYGWDNFEHEIISSNLTKEEADDLEKILIDELNTTNPKYGYNCMEGGSCGGHSEATRKKMSESHKGMIPSEETRKKISASLMGENNPMYGKHPSEETRKKISEGGKGRVASEETRKKRSASLMGENNPMYGKCHTEDARKKMSESRKGKRTGAEHPLSRKVVQYDMQGNFLKTWDSMSTVEKELGMSSDLIGKCCNGKSRHAGGYIWRYEGDSLAQEYIDWCNQKRLGARIKKSVVQYSLVGEFICVFDSMTKAELATGINTGAISLCCRGVNKTAGGFIWKYYENIEEVA